MSAFVTKCSMTNDDTLFEMRQYFNMRQFTAYVVCKCVAVRPTTTARLIVRSEAATWALGVNLCTLTSDSSPTGTEAITEKSTYCSR